jgi:hypothetical protein
LIHPLPSDQDVTAVSAAVPWCGQAPVQAQRASIPASEHRSERQQASIAASGERRAATIERRAATIEQREASVKVAKVALAFTLGLALVSGGCDQDASAGAVSRWPAGAAGIACQLIEYDAVADATGTRFDTAGGGRQDETLTCALTQSSSQFPYLTLAMTPTTVDEAIFTARVIPGGASPIGDLGKVAYHLVIAPAGPAGPAIELGWLSSSTRLMILRYTFAPSTPPEEVTEMGPKLVTLAQQVEDALQSP